MLLWIWPRWSIMKHVLFIHAQAQTKAQAWKVVHYFWWWCPSVHTSVRTKQNKNRSKIKPLFKLVLWLVLGSGSIFFPCSTFSNNHDIKMLRYNLYYRAFRKLLTLSGNFSMQFLYTVLVERDWSSLKV